MSDRPVLITAPPPPTLPRLRILALLAPLLPVAGGIVWWLTTGTVAALWMSALAPVLAVVSIGEHLRARRRARRDHSADLARTIDDARAAITDRVEQERRAERTRSPSLERLLGAPRLHWRAGPSDTVVLGRTSGSIPLDFRGGSPDDALRRACREVAERDDALYEVPWTEGVCVVGPEPLASAVLRALAAQLLLRWSPEQLTLVGALPPGWDALEGAAHRRPHSGAIGLCLRPEGVHPAQAAVVFAAAETAAAVDPRCGVVLSIDEDGTARVDRAGSADEARIRPSILSAAQFDLCIDAVIERARLEADRALDADCLLADALDARDAGRREALSAGIGADGDGLVVLDLVADGPHALVVGVTGSGKSVLLTSWIAALCAAYSTADLAFLLADFKGGTTFEALRTLSHVTGIITDLDGENARRALVSLRAEIRRRERALTAHGLSGWEDGVTGLPRLVIVVDEFAALVAEHPELTPVFTDVAARGRGLGIHLILATQRAAGVVRADLLGNCPLRIVLGRADPADATALLGDKRAEGSLESTTTGRALVRTGRDPRVRALRIARADPETLETIRRQRAAETPPRAPWLSALPEVLRRPGPGEDGADALGVVDDPEHQRRVPWRWDRSTQRSVLVIGGARSGRTSLLEGYRRLGGDAPRMVGPDPEQAWDTLEELADGAPASLALIDDLDALTAGYPDEYAQQALARIEALLRSGPGAPAVVASTRRVGAGLGRLGDLFSERILLPLPDREAFLAAGARATLVPVDGPPGRAVVGERIGQAYTPEIAPTQPVAREPGSWSASLRPTALATPTPERVVRALQAEGIAAVRLPDQPDNVESAENPPVLVADLDGWQRRWSVWTQMRRRGDLLVDARLLPEWRLLSGSRLLPPYARPGAGRAWRIREGGEPERLLVPALLTERARRRVLFDADSRRTVSCEQPEASTTVFQ